MIRDAELGKALREMNRDARKRCDTCTSYRCFPNCKKYCNKTGAMLLVYTRAARRARKGK